MVKDEVGTSLIGSRVRIVAAPKVTESDRWSRIFATVGLMVA